MAKMGMVWWLFLTPISEDRGEDTGR